MNYAELGKYVESLMTSFIRGEIDGNEFVQLIHEMEANSTVDNFEETLYKLLTEASELEREIAGVSAQITSAIEAKKYLDEPVDGNWFRKAKYSLAMKKHELGVLQDQIKKTKVVLLEKEHKKNREEKAKRHNKIREEKINLQKEFERCFIDVTKIELSEEQFSELISRAKQLQLYREGGLFLNEVK
jgi:hypothetical protein